uniref:NADH dehydrogenase subunit 11 n=1 Tax=Thraustochytrium aureum TaxID=42467 RepID=Q9G4C1_9STRA|nr:NADH dehydrogenase subunit 11 [Thraustochytrium aureum]
MVNLKINGIKLFVKKEITVLQACEKANFYIPKFCFHEKLLVAGNCRICLVEVKKTPKPVASCAMPLSSNIEIFTNSPLVRKARESVLEFLLINHPLDCPICDQGGECDLQNQTNFYGNYKSRFYFSNKRSVSKKNFGPLIDNVITRCIHCTRCVRFLNEVAGFNHFGLSGRGNISEIGFFSQDKHIFSKVSGNIVDLCPVSKLTFKKYDKIFS